MISFTKMEVFLCKIKVIFGISPPSCIESYITVGVSRKNKSTPVPGTVLKTSILIFCKPPKEFWTNWSQTFTKYSSTSSSSLTIAPFLIDKYNRCYGSPKNWGFCPKILIFWIKTSFWCKIKVIFGISSSSCFESYITTRVNLKNVFDLYVGKAEKNESYRIFPTIQITKAQLSSNFQRIFVHVASSVD